MHKITRPADGNQTGISKRYTRKADYTIKRPLVKGRQSHSRHLPTSFVLKMLHIKPVKLNSSGYYVLRCPFHKNGQEKNPSLNLHQMDGHFICHACGASGGNILDFYKRITRKSYAEAVKDLRVGGL